MSLWGSVRSLIESHRAKNSHPDRRNFIPKNRRICGATRFTGSRPGSQGVVANAQGAFPVARAILPFARGTFPFVQTTFRFAQTLFSFARGIPPFAQMSNPLAQGAFDANPGQFGVTPSVIRVRRQRRETFAMGSTTGRWIFQFLFHSTTTG